jgi:hypothetical protein
MFQTLSIPTVTRSAEKTTPLLTVEEAGDEEGGRVPNIALQHENPSGPSTGPSFGESSITEPFVYD